MPHAVVRTGYTNRELKEMAVMSSVNAELLNALDEMQRSMAYAVRRSVLEKAERVIYQQEQHIRELVKAGKELLRLIDDVGIDDKLGDETDRVFPRYEFDDLRKAVKAAQGSVET